MSVSAVRRTGAFFAMMLAACGPSGGENTGDASGGGGDAAMDGRVTDGGDAGRTTDSGRGRPDVSDSGGCGLVTCASAGATCGMIGDGCGGLIDCGTCTAPQTCGGGGTPSVCGGSARCTPRTCAQQGINCGPAGDGCGGTLACGECSAPDTCGGGGTPSVCGHGGATGDGGACVARTCAELGIGCGPAGDGCGGMLDCGNCLSPQTCGGGGTPGVCGSATCTPRTCAQAGANCGPVADGCGGLLDCGTCSAPETCGGAGTPSVCGVNGSTCTGLCLQQVTCPSAGTTTTLSGVVVTPAGATGDPLYNALVYIPNAPLQAFNPGVSCDRCGAQVSGAPLVSTTTGPDGRFVLRNVPVGANIPLVIQLGRWRRQVMVPAVTACVDNPVGADLTRLPRNHTEGDIPLVAMVTGAVDTLECVLRKIGLDDTEFTNPSGGGRIQFYQANGARISRRGTPGAATLTGSASTLDRYDMVLFACEGGPLEKPATDLRNVLDYANQGGRVFATHYSYTWLYTNGPFANTAQWNVDQDRPEPDGVPLPATVDQSFARGMDFATWLQNVGASTAPGQISINDPRHDVDGVVPPTRRWIYSSSPDTLQHLTFNTPVGTPEDQQCGRVLFSDFHVANVGSSQDVIFPTECSTGPLTPQEKVLEFMLFDLASCISSDMGNPGTCTPRTCAAAGANCGPIGDGCGGVIDCGTCPAGQTCGGGGTPSVCGSASCTPRTCAQQNIQCGPAGDGCGHALECGACPPGQTCGGGGTPGVCGGGSSCTPRTCTQQGIECGPAGDGCGHLLDCGTCPAGETCGGGGTPGVCGSANCTPRTCAQQGINCGPAGNGCGGVIDCGMCPAGQSCGGGGIAGVCGAPPG